MNPATEPAAGVRARYFLDAAAGEPMGVVVREAMLAAMDEGWADPGRLYTEARRAALLLDAARASVAAVIGAQPDEVSFAPSATLANHLGVLGLRVGPTSGRAAIASVVEHSSVLAALESDPGRWLPAAVDSAGRVDPADYAQALGRPGLAAAVLQSANQEVATRQPLEEVSALCRAAGVPLLVDAACSVGREPVPAWDVLTAGARMWGGPPGVGILAVRRGARWRSPGPEDAGELGRVPGEVALPAVLAAALALEQAAAGAPTESARLAGLVDRIRAEVPRRVPDVEVVGDPVDRAPHLVTFSCLYADGEALATELDRRGFAVGSGSACSSSTLRPSHVLAAMGVLTHGNVRVSLPRGTPSTTVEAFLDVLPEAVATVRARAGVAGL